MADKILKNTKLWEDLHRHNRFLLRYPHERVIQFVFANFPREKANSFKILDHGSGAGRHIIFLAENGYQTYGADVSRSGNSFTRKVLRSKKLSASINLIKSNTLMYSDNSFDAVISYGVLCYLESRQLDELIPDLYRILKKDGKIFLMLRSNKDYRLKYAKRCGHGDYLIVGDKKTRVNNEKGMVMHFFSKDDIKRRFKKFRSITIDTMINSYNGGKMVDYDYVVELKK